MLEIGCGTGSLALRLAPHVKSIEGLDISSEMIRIAREKVAAAGADNVNFHVGPFDDSFQALEYGSLDCVLAFSILHLLEDREAALQRSFELLRPGGHLISSTVCLGDSWLPFGALLWTMRKLGKAPWVAIIDEERIVADMAAAGFTDIETVDVGAKERVAFASARRPSS